MNRNPHTRDRCAFATLRAASAAALFGAVVLLVAVPGHAERVTLHNGRTLEGLITAQDEVQVQLRLPFGQITLNRSDIKQIDSSDPGEYHLRAGQGFLDKGLFKQAAAHLREARKHATVAPEAERLLELVAEAREASARDLLELEVHRALQIAAAGSLEDAIRHLETVREERGDSPILREALADLRPKLAYHYLDHLQYSRALEQVLLARDAGADRATLRYLVGLISHYQGREMAAQYEIAAALEERPGIRETFPVPKAVPVTHEPAGTAADEDALVVSWTRPRVRRPAAEGRAVVTRPAVLPTTIPANIKEAIAKASTEFHVPQELIVAVIEAESSFNPKAVSPAGAKGLMQLMPGTARDMGVRDVFDPEENIRGGTRYLALMMDTFDENTSHALAAYNAGPATVRFHKGIPPYPETRHYVKRVLARYDQLVVSSGEG